MNVLIYVINDVALTHLTSLLDSQLVADITNPRPDIPLEVRDQANRLLGWLKYAGLLAAIAGLVVCGIMMIVGRRGKSQTAVDGAIGIPWVLAGLVLVLLSGTIVNLFL